MRALTVVPKKEGSARLEDVPEPPLSDGALLVRTLLVGVCGTDREIAGGKYGEAPPGRPSLVLGHEVPFPSTRLYRRHRAPPGSRPVSQLARLITRRLPVEEWAEALTRRPGNVKTAIVFGTA